MAKLPQFQENKEKFSVHLEIVNGCMEYIKHNRIVDISNLEQVRKIHRYFRSSKSTPLGESLIRMHF
jgi:hypothetical protein